MLFKVAFDKEIHIIKSQTTMTLQDLKLQVPKVFKQHPERFYFTYLDEDCDEITLATEDDFKILLSAKLKSVKIIIKEKSEDFYDETQKVELTEEDYVQESINPIEELMEKDSVLNAHSEINTSSNQINLDESIEQKLRLLMPEIISKIKNQVNEEIINQSRLSAPKEEIKKPQVEEPKVIHYRINCDGCGKRGIEGIRYKCAVCPDFDFCQKCESSIDHPHPFLKVKNLKQTPVKIFAVINDEHDSLEVNGNRFNCPGFTGMMNNSFNFADQFMRQGRRCPYNRAQTQEKKQEEVKEKIVEVKIEEKIPEVKIEEKKPEIKIVEKKPEIKIEQKKPEVKVEEKVPEIIIQPIRERKLAQTEAITIQNANYIANILQIDFGKSFRFAQQNPSLSKQEILMLYISQQ